MKTIMMKNKNSTIGLLVAVISVGFITLLFNFYRANDNSNADVNAVPTPPQQEVACGIENCHGLEIECGPNVAEMCTMMYQAGDNCRQFASCEQRDGACVLKQDSKFEQCKSCVEACEAEAQENPTDFFVCESACAEL